MGKATGRGGTIRPCANCGEDFEATQEHSTFKRKYCSIRCSAEAQRARAVAKYPPREEIERLYGEEGMSDDQVGKHFGRSYNWAFKVRRHYGIAGRPARPKRKPLRQKNDRSRWGIHLKREPVCRVCGEPPDEIRPLNLHHAIPRSLAPAIKYDLRNGLPLCATCHLAWHRRELTIYRDVFTEEEWDFISGFESVGFRVGPWLDERYPARP